MVDAEFLFVKIGKNHTKTLEAGRYKAGIRKNLRLIELMLTETIPQKTADGPQ